MGLWGSLAVARVVRLRWVGQTGWWVGREGVELQFGQLEMGSWQTCIAASSGGQLGSKLFLQPGYLSWGLQGQKEGFCVLLPPASAAAVPAGKMGTFPGMEIVR